MLSRRAGPNKTSLAVFAGLMAVAAGRVPVSVQKKKNAPRPRTWNVHGKQILGNEEQASRAYKATPAARKGRGGRKKKRGGECLDSTDDPS